MVEVLSPYEVADLMGVSVRWVWRLLGDGELPGRRIGSRWFISESALERYLSGTDAGQKSSEGSPQVK